MGHLKLTNGSIWDGMVKQHIPQFVFNFIILKRGCVDYFVRARDKNQTIRANVNYYSQFYLKKAT